MSAITAPAPAAPATPALAWLAAPAGDWKTLSDAMTAALNSRTRQLFARSDMSRFVVNTSAPSGRSPMTSVKAGTNDAGIGTVRRLPAFGGPSCWTPFNS